MADAAKPQSQGEFILYTTLKIIGVLASIYFFLMGLDMMGSSFLVLGGKGAGDLFTIVDNPITGLMVGILATVLVQSSSTSTSIVVGLVGAGQVSVKYAIPIIMGANIGTSVTNTIVSMAHAGERLELERAFSGATVHDMFNFLSVLVMLPEEVIIGAITGDGGILYYISKGITEAVVGPEADVTFTSPTKFIVSPLTDVFVDPNKDVTKSLSMGAPKAQAMPTGLTGSCPSTMDCSNYFCVSSSMSKNWKKVDKDAYAALAECSTYFPLLNHGCGSDTCYLEADKFYVQSIEGGTILDEGAFSGMGDVAGGIVGLIFSLIIVTGTLFCLVKLLHSLIMGTAKKVIMRATNMNDYVAILVGLGITFIVQSSSVTTSTLTPLCGVGVLPVHKMFPMTLGANIGTTFTSMLAAIAVMKPDSLQIAFVHLLFNIFGILIWFPVPFMRRIPIKAACLLGFYASYWRLVPLIYILVMFVALPGVSLAISLLYGASIAGGIVVTLLALGAVAGFIAWWWMGGCYKAPEGVVSKELREERAAEIAAEMGEAEKPQETRQLARLQRLQSRLRQFKKEELSGCFTKAGVSAFSSGLALCLNRRTDALAVTFVAFSQCSLAFLVSDLAFVLPRVQNKSPSRGHDMLHAIEQGCRRAGGNLGSQHVLVCGPGETKCGAMPLTLWSPDHAVAWRTRTIQVFCVVNNVMWANSGDLRCLGDLVTAPALCAEGMQMVQRHSHSQQLANGSKANAGGAGYFGSNCGKPAPPSTTALATMADAAKPQSQGEFILYTTLKIIGVLASIYFFLMGLDMMGSSFLVLGGKGAGDLFTIVDNPITGLMVGILATVLVQSSSTSTSIVVGLVGAGQVSVKYAIPIIMGANIGTSVTNTIVSMAHAGERLELERAFSGATVHDMFNFLSVLVMLPEEVIIGAITGDGGILYYISKGITEAVVGPEADVTFTSPTKFIVSPLTDVFVDPNKDVTKSLSMGAPKAQAMPTGLTGSCPSTMDCSNYFCVSSSMSKNWKKVDKDAYAALAECSTYFPLLKHGCGSDTCYLEADKFYVQSIEGGTILDEGAFSGMGDVAGGIVGLIFSLIIVTGTLFCLVKLLHSLIMGTAKKVIMRATNMNDYVAILVGLGITFIVQSSSVTTSTLTPLCGVGVLPVHKMFPMTLGANIGTTFTSMLAAIAVMKPDSLQIAFVHLLFNIFGILIWFPVPFMRRIPIKAACLLGFYASYWRLVPLIYILVMFVALPGVSLAISLLYGASIAGGIVVTLLALGAVAGFIAWWWMGGCYKAPEGVVSKELREERAAEIAAEMGEAEKPQETLRV
ncbi:SLC34A1 [Symbiodinium sp. CCMP2592]|nr:SLC34A1 [Symbiodinium sp. CCMP2592]